MMFSFTMAQTIGGRATCVGLLDMADRIFEDEENADHFQLMQVTSANFQYLIDDLTVVSLASRYSQKYSKMKPPRQFTNASNRKHLHPMS